MDTKGQQDVITYPAIYFSIDDFDDHFENVVVRPGESICVELVATIGKVR